MTTVIACRSLGAMVADSKVTHRDSKFVSTGKVRRVGSYLVGVAGDYDPALAFVHRLARRLRGRDGTTVPELRAARSGDFEVIVLSRHGLWLYAKEGIPIEVEEEDFYAIGLGAACALASLRTQELLMVPPSLVMAAEVACEHDNDSGLPVVEVKLAGSSEQATLQPA